MKSFLKIFGFLCFLTLWNSKAILAAETPDSVPAECRTFEFDGATHSGQTASAVLLEAAEGLLGELKDLDAKFTPQTNAFERSFIWQRGQAEYSVFLNTFDFLRKSECLRKDVRSLEDLLAEIEHRYQQALKNQEKLQREIERRFAGRIEIIRREIPRLRKCGDVEKSPYFESRYIKTQCENSAAAKSFANVRAAFNKLSDKLEELFKGQKWKDMLGKEAWKNVAVGTDAEAAVLAQNWLQQNNIPALLGLPVKEESDEERDQKITAQLQKVAEEAAKRAAEKRTAALRNADRNNAFLGFNKSTALGKDLVTYGTNRVYELYTAAIESTAAINWKQAIVMAERTSKRQTERVKKLTEALKKVNNSQAKNVKN